MNEILQQWVAALRSGHYTQAKDVLESVVGGKSSFCCLGVLCSLAVDAGITVRSCNFSFVDYAGADTMPPDSVYEWSGLSEELADKYVAMNDSGATFNEIADEVENDHRGPKPLEQRTARLRGFMNSILRAWWWSPVPDILLATLSGALAVYYYRTGHQALSIIYGCCAIVFMVYAVLRSNGEGKQ